MAASITLTPVSIAIANNKNSIDLNKCKNEENTISVLTQKSTERRISSPQETSKEIDNSFIRNIPTFRIPKIPRASNSISSSEHNQEMQTETNNNISSQISITTINSSSTRQLNDDCNSQQGKRKFSLSQYKEHKRLKSNDIVHNSSADVDMRINTIENIKNSPPTAMDDDTLTISDNQSIVSPKMDNINKDVVIKSNLSEPGLKKIIKKKVIWADEKNHALVQTLFFEIDNSEMTDMHAFAHQCATNMSIAKIEKLLERDFRKQRGLQDINSFDNDNRQNLPPLPALIPILLPDTIPIPIVKSQEHIAQEEREKTVLQALYIRPFLPENPGEPDGDLFGNSTIERNEPKLIPLDDNTSSVASNQVSSVNTHNSTSTNISLPSTNSTSTVTSSLSSFSHDNVSPEVAQILAQAKENLISTNTNNLSPTIVDTPINPPTIVTPTNPPLVSTPNLLSALLNITRSNISETTNITPINPLTHLVSNLSSDFNRPPPTHLSFSQLLVNALSLGIPPSSNFNNSMFQPLSTTLNTPPASPIATTINSNNNSAIISSTIHSVSTLNQQTSRFNNNNNNNKYHMTSYRENNRGYNYRRGLHNNNNHNNNRRDYYHNRNNNNNNNMNNNRNVFS